MKKANGWLITYLGLIAMVMLVGLVAVWLGGCATVPNTVVIRDSGTSSRQLLTHNRQDPGVGVFVQTGNALLEIEIYKDTEVREKNGKKERRSEQIAAVILQPASMGRSLEYRYGRAVWVSEQWLNLESGHYTLLIYPSRGKGPFKRQLPRQTHWLTVDDDPADNVYNGVYVGWLERFEISDYEGSPKYEFQFDLNKLKD
ncbi:MAG: hypothetical protein UX53_C0003G0024 [Candidatus Azambacteria bacterium GW2011_GWB2_46_37]|uniref:Uncharacterized protein n=5 Tax=Candidatus Azamiibacteriota TaxID=1752741 RepID=A0A0G1Q608_9BACT|nr:MAG: hypothetical protein UX48_C0014G0002 [Candidatus Azambacteria bacterium GW2011_GWB1_46_27]KKU37721.1 MAG: hypothetical protein UX51_C0015G0033 [Candidatus Azambacteria bacterium GW2011_GWF2_46_32]KKU39583.1 MAG: hypothetical protein UX53_C0003G0024 [Candidatus Azambacteria bacterium GW2011_GWB2_46_37]KKU40265.1 MAG: hypothetical protein UX56_C0038G0004 [Candidatus Azambacteria bacterium GW2011_GWD2_46_48]KKU40434.1 MAG: hypothetical protein UX55_C0006G0002 [Candidatus Azambacteria bacte